MGVLVVLGLVLLAPLCRQFRMSALAIPKEGMKILETNMLLPWVEGEDEVLVQDQTPLGVDFLGIS